jgi:hypothetical protein
MDLNTYGSYALSPHLKKGCLIFIHCIPILSLFFYRDCGNLQDISIPFCIISLSNFSRTFLCSGYIKTANFLQQFSFKFEINFLLEYYTAKARHTGILSLFDFPSYESYANVRIFVDGKVLLPPLGW